MTSNNGPLYQSIVRELADATGFVYPETPQELQHWRDQFECRIMARRRRLRRQEQENNNNNNNPQPGAAIRSWMLIGPQEWSYCSQSNLPKPPRSHYDHVTKKLVLNMDHYCPWMFNTVGFLNYRYFVNFLIFVSVGMVYGAYITYHPFMAFHWMGQKHYKSQRQQNNDPSLPWTPTSSQELAISFSFMICASVGIAVMFLMGFHLYLVLTAQTTIEFHGNLSQRRRARLRGTIYVNPYDLGLNRNFQQLWGAGNVWLAILIPSSREPQFLPVPIPGDLGKRHPKSKESAILITDSSPVVVEETINTYSSSPDISVFHRSSRIVESTNGGANPNNMV
eukprot:CAMPEP_0197836032 /NCGR_PEP_ID=MMETSP1437-20131217/27729_1 /TAXON_ID=49252 ORGANISM="Eucampia antarctica, Strain CCMP1452" /NCGR_SAMPLE_ID=MMETSP1437 /ASSEMBLY_ACC=CAM_ASM_001096 /LENGTH=336 /DNA_ID=CAMNT_0043441883 /DNA_START=379 /DNA_END=1389 /DNA_ORIENTATION=-